MIILGVLAAFILIIIVIRRRRKYRAAPWVSLSQGSDTNWHVNRVPGGRKNRRTL